MEWISVNDRLPEYSVNVLAIEQAMPDIIQVFAFCEINEDGGFFNAWCNCNGNLHSEAFFDDNYNITHWQPLPEPPKQ